MSNNDLDDLLEELADVGVASPPSIPVVAASSRASAGAPAAALAGGKSCVPVQSLSRTSNGRVPRLTDTSELSMSLRCTRCDFSVESFDDGEWSRSADYLFFRNYSPDRTKLSGKLIRKPGSRSYCCQCNWKSLSPGESVIVDRFLSSTSNGNSASTSSSSSGSSSSSSRDSLTGGAGDLHWVPAAASSTSSSAAAATHPPAVMPMSANTCPAASARATKGCAKTDALDTLDDDLAVLEQELE